MEKHLENLLKQIESMKKQIATTAKLHGLTSTKTIEQSCQLDQLVMEYQKLDFELQYKNKKTEMIAAIKAFDFLLDQQLIWDNRC